MSVQKWSLLWPPKIIFPTAAGNTKNLSLSIWYNIWCGTRDNTLKLLRLYTQYFFSLAFHWYSNFRYAFLWSGGLNLVQQINFFLFGTQRGQVDLLFLLVALHREKSFLSLYETPFGASYWDLWFKNGICTELVLI